MRMPPPNQDSTPIGHPAVTSDGLSQLMDLSDRGEHDELRRELETMTSDVHRTCTPGILLTETEKLLDEALWHLRAGDIEEATYRLVQASAAYEPSIEDMDDDDDCDDEEEED